MMAEVNDKDNEPRAASSADGDWDSDSDDSDCVIVGVVNRSKPGVGVGGTLGEGTSTSASASSKRRRGPIYGGPLKLIKFHLTEAHLAAFVNRLLIDDGFSDIFYLKNMADSMKRSMELGNMYQCVAGALRLAPLYRFYTKRRGEGIKKARNVMKKYRNIGIARRQKKLDC